MLFTLTAITGNYFQQYINPHLLFLQVSNRHNKREHVFGEQWKSDIVLVSTSGARSLASLWICYPQCFLSAVTSAPVRKQLVNASTGSRASCFHPPNFHLKPLPGFPIGPAMNTLQESMRSWETR